MYNRSIRHTDGWVLANKISLNYPTLLLLILKHSLSSGECVEGCDNTTTGPCWQEQQIVFPPYGLTGNACIFTNNTYDYCTGKYIDPNTGQLN